MLAALYGGFGPALFANGLSALIGTYLFIGQGPGHRDLLEPANIGIIGGRLDTGIAQGIQAAAVCVTKAGAQASIPYRRDLLLLPQADISSVEVPVQ